jgi:carbon starvation protein
MSLLAITLASAAFLLAAYLVYGRVLSRLLRLDPDRKTPAVELRDDVDYVPIEPRLLLGQHFSAIAAAGPIVGPILAGIAFGWFPALIWILLGAVFIGGVHDMTALVASIRHRACSIAEVVRDHMSRRSYLLFLTFIWLALVYIIVAFTDITASSFVGPQELESGETILGEGIATSSLLYLALPILMGLLLRFTRIRLWAATLIFLPLVGVAIWLGQKIPLDLAALLGLSNPADAIKVWNVALVLYCLAAAVIPMWLLLQPRGHLGGYFLLAALASGAAGLLFSGKETSYPAFTGWTDSKGDTLFPMLFITIACGACSGFHALIASGTTSKQLRRETDAKPIAYGSMLLEAMVAVVSLACVMILARGAQILESPRPNLIYALGLGEFLGVFGVPQALAVSFGLMAFTTFVYDTLDVCTRLGRYIIEELTGWRTAAGRWFAAGLTAGAPLFFLLRTNVDAMGRPAPAWRTFWQLFGASNQLLAALTLLGVTVWLWRAWRARWAWFVVGLPAAWMYAMSVWALVNVVRRAFATEVTLDPVAWIAVVLISLAALMLLEAFLVIFGAPRRPPVKPEPLPAPA